MVSVSYAPQTAVSYTHLDVYKRQGLEPLHNVKLELAKSAEPPKNSGNTLSLIHILSAPLTIPFTILLGMRANLAWNTN